ncbi:MAG: 50S ribosomal protein L6 [Chlamydiota bacterium]
MSRLGKIPIPLPKGVEIKVDEKALLLTVKGPKGTVTRVLENGISVSAQEGFVHIGWNEKVLSDGAYHGLYRSLVKNCIEGVSKGFEKKLTLVGVGFRAAVKGSVLDLKVGFSHPTEVSIPKGVHVTVDKGIDIVITGLDKEEVGSFAAKVRSIKKPEPYKGKGIRYVGEYVRKKAGKAAKTAAAATTKK